MGERRRAGATVIPKGRPPADRALLQPQSIVAQDHLTDSWRVLRFIAEFVEGFDALSDVGTAVTCFGSARTRPDQPKSPCPRHGGEIVDPLEVFGIFLLRG